MSRFYAEYTSRKKLLEKSDLKYNYVQMPDSGEVLDNAQQQRAHVLSDLHHVHPRHLAWLYTGGGTCTGLGT